MNLDVGQVSALILALTGAASAYGAHRLNQRGKLEQAVQQTAANKLADRAQGFEEMETVVEWQAKEITRLEARAERESLAQARRCRTALDHFTQSYITLMGQVANEGAKRNAERGLMESEVHLAEDHPEPKP